MTKQRPGPEPSPQRQERPGLLVWTVSAATLFAATWALVALLVDAAVRLVPGTERELLEAFAVYARPDAIGGLDLMAELARGAVLALILAPFRGVVLRHERPFWVLFGVYFGLVALGSVEPLPGSMEGWFYTRTSLPGHGVIVIASALHGAAMAWALPRALAWLGAGGRTVTEPLRPATPAPRVGWGRIARFTLLHAVTYLALGLVFFTLQDYSEAFATQAQFRHFRPLDDPWVAAAIPAQIPRGMLLAWFLAPFVPSVIQRRRGGVLLFTLLFGTTAIGAGNILPGLLGATATPLTLSTLLVGFPEVATQMLVFSLAFVAWESRRARRSEANEPRRSRHERSGRIPGP